MTNTNFDELGLDDNGYPKPKRRKSLMTKDLGKLHALLVKGLPDYVQDGILDVTRLSEVVGISFQAIYKWFEREQIGAKRIKMIVELSVNTKNRPKPTIVEGKKVGWSPLQHDDFWEFHVG